MTFVGASEPDWNEGGSVSGEANLTETLNHSIDIELCGTPCIPTEEIEREPQLVVGESKIDAASVVLTRTPPRGDRAGAVGAFQEWANLAKGDLKRQDRRMPPSL
jgi:hypothetical protein